MESKKYRKGLRNNYRIDMPVAEVVLKDLKETAGDLKRWVSNGFNLPVIVVWPDFPSKRTTIFKIARLLGCRITNQLVKNPALVIYFDDSTSGNSDFLTKHYPGHRILNSACTDISKVKVDQIHLDVFGYNTLIDPATYVGKAVVKSDINALHDGQIVDCPINAPSDKSKVYQVLIDNGYDEKLVMDYRVPVVLGCIPHGYIKFKEYKVRFTNEVSFSVLKDANDCLNPSEQMLVIEFAKSMGADFCELDILRNNLDGKIYVIDVNKTPFGPPFGLPEEQASLALSNQTGIIRSYLKESL